MTTAALDDIHRPLRLGELLAASVRIYGSRGWAFIGVGCLQAAALLIGAVTPFVGYIAVASLAFAVAFAVVVRLVVGDPFGPAMRRTASSLPVLVVLAFVVGVPFYLGSTWLVLLIFSAVWLGVTAFAIPAMMVEEPEDGSWPGRVAFALRRTVALARIEFGHAVGVVAALLIVYLLVGVVLALALYSFADNGQLAALALTQLVLSPYFFIGLSVLYFEQRARAVESAGRPGKGR